jgi:uncharacterized DUF497 family protein
MMVLGRRLSTPVGTLKGDANVCLTGTHCATLVALKYFAWDDAKNAKLRADRGIGFEDIVFHIERGDVLDILERPNPERYAGQRMFVVQSDDYVYLVPFAPSPARLQRGLRRGLAVALRAEADVEDEHTVFLENDHSNPEGHQGVPR